MVKLVGMHTQANQLYV